MTINFAISSAQHADALLSFRPRELTCDTGSRRMAILSETAALLLQGRDPDREVLPALFGALSSELKVDATLGYVVTDVQKGLCLGFAKGFDTSVLERILRLDFGQAICGRVAATGQAAHATDVQNNPDPMCDLVRSIGITAYACEPLIIRGKVIGTLSFASRSRPSFDPQDLQFFEAVARHVALARDRGIHDQAVSNNRELRHRMRSLLTNVQATAALSARSVQSLDGFADALSDRIAAMSDVQELIGQGGYADVTLHDLVECQLDPYGMDRISLDGPETSLCPDLVIPLGMALHELSSNASKFGALSRQEGRVRISWRQRGSGRTSRLLIQWLERGGPAVSLPRHAGFGTQLLTSLLGNRFLVERDFAPAGLSARIQVSLDAG